MMRRKVFVLELMVVMMSMCLESGFAQKTATEYLSDILERLSFIQQGWGELGIDTAAHAPGKTPLPLRIKDKQYEKGLGHHAPGEIVVELEGLYTTFESEVGVQWQSGDNIGSVVFQVFVDGKKRFDSGVMKELDQACPIRLSVTGAQELRLVVTDAGDGITCDCANWANARLTRAASAKPQPLEEPLDIAPFARLVTWDPNRMDGSRSSRVEEFSAQDVFMESEVIPDANGRYAVPVAQNGLGCIGLQWSERRRLKELVVQFADPAHIPSQDKAQVQAWFGESHWQGTWEPLNGKIEPRDDKWLFRVDWKDNPKIRPGTEKIRWVFPPSAQPIVLRRLSAFTDSRWDTIELCLELEKPIAGRRGEIEVYNGEIVISSTKDSPWHSSWDLSKPLRLKVRYSRPRQWKADRTLLWLKLPAGAFGVAVEDVLAHECVYVRDFGVFIIKEPARLSLAECRRKVARRKPPVSEANITVLQRVRQMPDQTFAQAMAKVHRPVQDNGPTMLSLACDNRKFVVQREGAVRFEKFELSPQMGLGRSGNLTRHLHGGWLPVPVTTIEDNGIVYQQRTFVVPYDKMDIRTKKEPAWLNRQPLCLVEFTMDNPLSHPASANLKLTFWSDADKKEAAQLQPVSSGFLVQEKEKLLASIDITEITALKANPADGTLTLSGEIPAQTQQRCFIYIPAWEIKPEDHHLLAGGEKLLYEVETYWKRVLAPAMQIEIPEPLLNNLIRTSQVHCLIAARNCEGGKTVAPWIASTVYGPLESEAHSIILGMDLMGHHEFARRGLEFFIQQYHPAGFLTTGYTLMGTGWHLWTLAQHYQLTQDSPWLKKVAPKVARASHWITQQLEKTKRRNPRGEKVPEYGLMPPGVAADWNRFAYRFFVQGNYCAGLHKAARALQDIGHPEAGYLLQRAEEFRNEIRRAYKWAQSRAPVLPLSDGTWVPAYPSMLYCFGLAGEMFPGEDWGRSWASDVEVGAHHLVPLGILEPASREVTWITEHLEDFWFLHSGMGDYPEQENRKDWFNLGGFSKLQPFYTRIAEIYALRDEVKPFIRSYFNAIPSLLNTENLSFWEHFHNAGAWNKTHETGWFLVQTRLMFVMERGDELWLAPFVTNQWLKDGMTVAVRNAPTRFGNLSYRVTSHIQRGFIEAVIEPPKRTAPKALVIRLRHPEGKRIRKVTINGLPHKDFDRARECISIKPTKETITVRAEY